MAQTMRAVDIKDGAGPATSLYINDQTPRPTLRPHEALVRIHYFGLNRADTLQREGKYPVPAGAPQTLGLEFSGVIETPASASDSSSTSGTFKKGDPVFGLCYGGAYAEFVAVDTGMLIHKPEELSWEVCGGLCEVWFTALQALYLVGGFGETGGSEGGSKSVLWHAGGSGVAIAGQQLCRHAAEPAPNVFVTARQDSKIEWCKKTLGATGGANTKSNSEGWAEEIRKMNGGEGVDLMIDFIGAPVFAGNLALAAQDGRIVQQGVMGGVSLPPGTDISAFVRKRVRFMGSTLRSRKPEYQRKLRDLFVEKALPYLVSGEFENHVDRVFEWEKVGEAHKYMESNASMGKIICKVG